MSVYKEVPYYWYGAISFVGIVTSIVTIEVYKTEMPIWSLFLILFLSSILVVPLGFILALTNQLISFQVLGEILCGYMLPGKLVAGMLFKAFFINSVNQTLQIASMLKLGHYMKIPPRITFVYVILAYAITILGSVSIQAWILGNLQDACTPDQPNRFYCPTTEIFSSAALLWNGIGPQRLFSSGRMYVLLIISDFFRLKAHFILATVLS